jgi:hypothetical protein
MDINESCYVVDTVSLSITVGALVVFHLALFDIFLSCAKCSPLWLLVLVGFLLRVLSLIMNIPTPSCMFIYLHMPETFRQINDT